MKSNNYTILLTDQNEHDSIFTYFSKINSSFFFHSFAIVTMPLADLGQKLRNSLVHHRQCFVAIGHRASVNRRTASRTLSYQYGKPSVVFESPIALNPICSHLIQDYAAFGVKINTIDSLASFLPSATLLWQGNVFTAAAYSTIAITWMTV